MRRRELLHSVLFGGVLNVPLLSRGKDTSRPSAQDVTRAIQVLRAADLRPGWFISPNWDNRSYEPWTDYLAGRMADDDFMKACAKTTDYCLRDIWNLRQRGDLNIRWDKLDGFNWNGVHALALRYFRTGESAYLERWLRIVTSFSQWAPQGARDGSNPLNTGAPPALLSTAITWCGIFTALAIICKSLGTRRSSSSRLDGSPYLPVTSTLDASAIAALPQEGLIQLAGGFAKSSAPQLAKWYSQPRYVPNQRMFGLEALAYLASCFPGVSDGASLTAPTHLALADVMVRYRQLDGGQLEQSFNYAEDLVSAARRVSRLPFDGGDVWRRDAELTVTGWDRMSAALATPGGGLPQLGNAPWGRAGRDAPQVEFASTSFAFPFSGHYVQRSEWSRNAAYLYFFQRRAARGHTMAGSNSVQLAAFGQPLLIAGGAADYRAGSSEKSKSASHLDESSSWKTNTILVDLQSQAEGDTDGLPTDSTGKPDILRVPQSPIRSRWLASSTFDFLEGTHKTGYGKGGRNEPLIQDVQHRRQIAFVRPLKIWVIVDRMVTMATHQYHQVWKFAPPQGIAGVVGFGQDQVVVDVNERRIRTQRGDKPNITLHHFGIADLGYESHFGDEFGWFSPGSTSNAVPTVDVHAVWRGKGPQALATLIVPYQGSQSPLSRVSSEVQRYGTQFRAEFADGSQLAVTVPAGLARPETEAGRLELLVTLSQAGTAPAELRITEGGGEEKVGTRVRPCFYPATFSWVTDGSSLVPSYGR